VGDSAASGQGGSLVGDGLSFSAAQCDASSAPLVLFITILSVGLVVFCVPFAVAMCKGRGSKLGSSMSMWERRLLLGIFVASLVLVVWCGHARLFANVDSSCLGASACAFSTVSLTASTLLLLASEAGKLHPRSGKRAFASFFALWWTCGSTVLTFLGPFTFTSNPYFACWFNFALSFALLALELSETAAERTEAAKAALLEKRELAALLASSAAMIGVCIVARLVGAAVIYAFVCGCLTALLVLPMLCLAHRLPPLLKASISLLLFGLWVAVVAVATFSDGPFAATGNGFFAAWVGLACSTVLLVSDGPPLLHVLSGWTSAAAKQTAAAIAKRRGQAAAVSTPAETSASSVEVSVVPGEVVDKA